MVDSKELGAASNEGSERKREETSVIIPLFCFFQELAVVNNASLQGKDFVEPDRSSEGCCDIVCGLTPTSERCMRLLSRT